MKSVWLKRILLTVVLLGGLFGAIGAWLAPSYIKRTIEETAGDQLGRKVSIQALDISPYALRMKIAGFAIHAQGEARLIAVDEIDAALSWSSMYRLVPVVDHLTITGLKLSFARLEPNRYDFSDIVDRLAARPKGGASTAFMLNHFAIEGGSIDFDDQPEQTRHEVRNLRLRVPFLSSDPGFADADVEPVFTAVANGMAVDLSGKLKPFKEPLGASLKLEFKNLDLTKYVEYAPFPLGVKLASGMVDGDFDVTLSNQKDKGTVLVTKGQLSLGKLDIRERSGAPLIALGQLKLDVAALQPFERSAQIQSLSAEGLDLRIVRRAAGFNFDALRLPATAEVKNDPAESATAPKFALAEVSIIDGKVEFIDETVTPAFRSVAQGITLTARGLSNEPGSKADIDLALATRAGETLKAQGNLGLAPLTLEAKVAAEKVALAAYAPYFAPFINASLEGVLSASANLSAAAQAEGLRFGLNALRLRADSLKLAQPGIEILRLAALSLNAAEINPEKRSVTGVEISAKEGRLEIKRGADGELNLAKLLVPGTAAPAGATPAAKETPWAVDLRKAQLEGIAVGFEDSAVAPMVRVELAPLALLAEGLSTRPGVPGRMVAKLTVNRAGTIEASGPLTLQPFAAQLAVDAQNLGIVPFQPYFRPFINALVTSGGVSTKGELQIKSGAGGLAANYAGDAGVGAFTLMDAEATQPLVTFKSLQIEGIKAASQPLDFSVGPIALAEFYSRIVVQPDGRINLQNIIPPKAPAAKPDPAPAEKPAAAATPAKPADASGASAADARLRLRIGRFALQGGTIEFSDQSIKPNFSARVTDLGGSIAGLSGDPASRAEVALKGLVGGNAPLDISGTVNPLAGNLFLDLKAVAKGIDLNPMTPYSARYAGYGIEKGKMSLDLAYRIENRKLDARHKIFLDQLTFGDRVESPEATKLPVLLVLALLKNSRGEIDIELPIGGSLDDPEFSFGAIIGKVIVNLLVKVITAPFALLGAIFGGGGEELSYIEFDPGLAVLGAEQETKLRNLSKALTDRSGLRLEMAGRTEEASDREGLKREALRQKVRAQKVASTVGQGTDVKTAAELQVLPAEYADFLKRAYERETFTKPRNALGIARTLPVDEMEKLILANTEIGEQRLRDLAARRAEAVRDWMVKSGGIGSERIFLVAPRDDSSDKDSRAKTRGNRVDMYIK